MHLDINIQVKQHDPTIDFAVNELKKYLGKIIDTNKKIKCLPKYKLEVKEKSGNDHVVISQDDNQCLIVGNHKIALLIGIYQYLRILGIKFLRPGIKNEKIPYLTSEELQKHISYDHVASYKHRGVCIEGADSVQNITDFIDWLPKIGFNSFFIQFENPYTFLKRWYSHQFNNYWEDKTFTNEEADEMNSQINKAMNLRALHQHRVGHGWTGSVLGFSSKYGWESGKKISKDKKPLVALVNGKRELIDGTPIFTSVDFANPEVNEKLADVIVNYARKHREVDYLHVWLSDACNNICECETCQKTTPSDQYVEFLNYLDQRLTDVHLDTKICFLLYHELLYAPQKAKIKNPSRFVMMFAPISRTFEKSYADVDYEHGIPRSPQYIRNKITLPNSLESNLSFLFDWQKIFKGDSFVYDYPLGRAHYGDLGYMAISKVISRDIKYLDKLHLNGYISCQELRSGFPTTFPNYVMGLTLWDKNISFENLEKEYFKGAYGKNYQKVISYLTRISDLSSPDYFNAIGPRFNPARAKDYKEIVTLTDKFLDTIIGNLSKAKGVEHHNWSILAYHREAFNQLAKALLLIASGKNQKAESCWKNFIDFIKLHEVEYQQELDVYRITEVATNYAGFKYRDQ